MIFLRALLGGLRVEVGAKKKIRFTSVRGIEPRPPRIAKCNESEVC